MSQLPTYQNEVRTRITIEGVVFEVTKGTDDLAETPGRIGLWVVNEHGSSVKVYFDEMLSLEDLSLWFAHAHKLQMATRHQKVTA